MTAEVVALNKSAVAMAADSKGTVRISGVVKTHDTINKLFTLSKYHPVGVMIYGNAEVMDVPWETVIKVYRDKLRDKCFPRVNSYANDFIACLKNDYYSMFSRAAEFEGVYWMARDFIENIVTGAEDYLDRYSVKPVEAIEFTLEAFEEGMLEEPVLFGFRDITGPEILALHSQPINQAFTATLAKKFHAQFQPKTVELVAEAFRRSVFSEGRSGIVFAGFGDKEIFPFAKSFVIDGIVAGRLRGTVSHRTRIGNVVTASIRPFAQGEMVYRFMEGIDPNYREYLEEAVRGIADNIAGSIIKRYVKGSRAAKDDTSKKVLKIVDKEIDKFINEGRAYRNEKFVDPIVAMTQLLPKEELAHLAESFVNLTSLKRRVSLDDESVGGPIDVAVISKGDGFVWIKRKHYFDRNLNATFLPNYFREHVQSSGETGVERIRKTTT